MKHKRLFGLIRYVETEEGDRLTDKSVEDTVHTGMAIGVMFSTGIAYTLYQFMSGIAGNTVGLLSVVVFMASWILTSYFSYQTVCDKVEDSFRKHGEYYEGND